jgi:D-alanyl-D-alanine dipeptidase
MIPNHFTYISSPIIQAISVKDNGEKLVDLYDYAGGRGSKLRTQPGVQVREGVADKLINAQLFLDDDKFLYIVEGYRSEKRQKELWDYECSTLKNRHSEWSKEKIELEASKLFSPPGSVMPHAAGAAVDVTLVNSEGEIFDLGTQINEDAESTENRTYTLTQGLTEKQMENRMLLIDAMNNSQFTNYATEWWHWSFGDQYWAFTHKQPFAVYDKLK